MDARRMMTASVAIVREHRLGMQVVRERNGEEQQDQSAANCGPLSEWLPTCVAVFAHPTQAPQAQDERGDQHPKTVEKRFHGFAQD
jgi:hypothetical protein